MTPQELKNSILQLAVQGKLVEQRLEEGTAEELYKQIQAEKQALIKAGKIKKEKPLPEITEDEIPFEIPESWKWVHLNQIAESGLGKTLDKAKNTGELCRYLCSINVYWNGISLETVKTAKFTEDDKAKYRLKRGDLLICEGGDVGRSAIWDSDEEMYYQNALHRVRFFGGILSAFFRFVVECYKGIGIIDEYSKGMTIKHLVQNSLYAMWLPLPPLAEQKRIVAKIEELLPLVERYEKAWSRLEDFSKRFPVDMQKSILQMAIQGNLVEQRPEEGTGEELYKQIQTEKQALIKAGKIKKEKPLLEITEDEVPFEIPESWIWVRLLSVVDIATNLVQPSMYSDLLHVAPDNIEKGTGKLLLCRTVQEDRVASANHLFYKGQVLYSKIRPLLRKAIVAPFDGLCSADMYPLDTKLEKKYLLYFLLSDAFNHQVAIAMSSRVKMPKINQDELGKTLIPLPPLFEQKRIVTRLEELLPLCERLK